MVFRHFRGGRPLRLTVSVSSDAALLEGAQECWISRIGPQLGHRPDVGHEFLNDADTNLPCFGGAASDVLRRLRLKFKIAPRRSAHSPRMTPRIQLMLYKAQTAARPRECDPRIAPAQRNIGLTDGAMTSRDDVARGTRAPGRH